MVVKELILSILLERYPAWADSPEDFLGFITLAAYLSRADADAHGAGQLDVGAFAEELARIFIEVVGVNIAPYRDYNELNRNCMPMKGDIAGKLKSIVAKMKEDDAIFDLTEGAGVMHSKETMIDEIADDFRCRAIINKLRPYVAFI